ncbi:SPOR domain-containing protein [Ferriphaselus sp. R-1]|uniref:SPOR domain-containing protein n=1 Tax=Ferriphaselus sp. R-1 TaxID=1485544 RepID=UPI000552BF62|nr:SPOR domain-containing protein [Ferriphaselus sp. R-1]
MSKNMVGRAPAPKKPSGKGGGLFVGILLGMVFGLVVAGGVAWYLMKLPSPFTKVEQQPDSPVVDKPLVQEPPRINPAPAAPASSPEESKPRFEFYKVLTDKKDASVPMPQAPAKIEDRSFKPDTATEATDNTSYFLQTGSYSSEADAENEKARLAMQGMLANVQSVFVPEKGQRYRVRLGPYKGAAEMNKVRTALKQIGVEATPMRAK